MFGYVRPPLEILPQEEADRFRRAYCGLCHTLGERYGPAARMILNYDFTYLAILLSDPEEAAPCRRRCVSSPVRLRAYQPATAALELAADESVILAYWQLRDGVEDHGLWKGLGYRVSAAALRGGYRKAAAARPGFDGRVREQLAALSRLEGECCPSMDQAADTFAQLLAAAAAGDITKGGIEYDKRSALGVVLAARGYPEHPEKGAVITGLSEETDDAVIFHAGTATDANGNIVVSGGRVLCVVGLGDTLKEAHDAAYRTADQVHFDGVQKRRDIGYRAL